MQPDEEEGEEEEMGVAETYADYMPAKLKLGKKHPDPVVETASLSSVEPADVTYKLSIPTETINNGLLSALQLESITYASQAHDQLLPDGSRAGFLVGMFNAHIKKQIKISKTLKPGYAICTDLINRFLIFIQLLLTEYM